MLVVSKDTAAGSLARAAVRRSAQGVHLRFLEVRQRARRRLPERSGGKLGAPGKVLSGVMVR
jgi:hypothetical protein